MPAGQVWSTKVDPRGCGGTVRRCCALAQGAGRSPRVRGNRAWTSYAPSVGRVDPRGCGGTSIRSRSPVSRSGRSPRVRGNLPHNAGQRRGHGSIPAGAGEPLAANTLSSFDCPRSIWCRTRTRFFPCEHNATGIDESMGRRSEGADALPARRRRIPPRHHDRSSAELRMPVRYDRPDPFPHRRREVGRGVDARRDLQHRGGEEAAVAVLHVTGDEDGHRHQTSP